MCRTAREKSELIRVVRTPDRRIIIDHTGRLAGRGAYLCRRDDCIRVGVERALARALEVPIPAGLGTELGMIVTPIEGGARGQE